MYKVTAVGTYFHKTGHKVNEKRNFKEEFLLDDSLYSRGALMIIRRMLITKRLEAKIPEFLGVKECSVRKAVKVTNVKSKYTEDEIDNLKDNELLELAAQRGLFIKGSRLSHINDLREWLLGDEKKRKALEPRDKIKPKPKDEPVEVTEPDEF